MHLLFATRNAHKAAEVAAMLEGTGIEVTTLLDHDDLPDIPETEHTFEGNALLKARFVHARTGMPVIADDSGIAVDALDGAPGVHSKRFTPEATTASNNRHLLERLTGVPPAERAARFVCALALVTTSWEGTVRGVCEGMVTTEPRGDGGFGYDPLFVPEDLDGRSMAEASSVEKNAISHRGRAFRQLPRLLSQAGLIGQADTRRAAVRRR